MNELAKHQSNSDHNRHTTQDDAKKRNMYVHPGCTYTVNKNKEYSYHQLRLGHGVPQTPWGCRGRYKSGTGERCPAWFATEAELVHHQEKSGHRTMRSERPRPKEGDVPILQQPGEVDETAAFDGTTPRPIVNTLDSVSPPTGTSTSSISMLEGDVPRTQTRMKGGNGLCKSGIKKRNTFETEKDLQKHHKKLPHHARGYHKSDEDEERKLKQPKIFELFRDSNISQMPAATPPTR